MNIAKTSNEAHAVEQKVARELDQGLAFYCLDQGSHGEENVTNSITWILLNLIRGNPVKRVQYACLGLCPRAEDMVTMKGYLE